MCNHRHAIREATPETDREDDRSRYGRRIFGIARIRISASRRFLLGIRIAFICNLIYIMPQYYAVCIPFLFEPYATLTIGRRSPVNSGYLLRLSSARLQYGSVAWNLRAHRAQPEVGQRTVPAVTQSPEERSKFGREDMQLGIHLCNAPERRASSSCQRIATDFPAHSVHPFPWPPKAVCSRRTHSRSSFYHRNENNIPRNY